VLQPTREVVTGGDSRANGTMAPLDGANKVLEDANERRRLVDEAKAKVQRKLDALKEERMNKGRGRPNKAHESQKAAAEAQMRRLERGFLPGEVVPPPSAPQTDAEVRASAAQHSQHHASAGTAPAGRPAQADRGGGGSGSGGSGGSGGNGGGGGGNGAATNGGGDDDVEDTNFHQYYSIAANQRAFNEQIMSDYMKGERDRKLIKVEPYELIGSGCNPELIGVGPVHICAPHLHMGLPLPPCPRHGWRSVDEGKLHTRGCCPARRVYAQTVDEWLCGVVITCGLCEDEKREAEKRLAEMEEDDEAEGTSELQEACAEVAEATYSYRCAAVAIAPPYARTRPYARTVAPPYARPRVSRINC
jgi:hypothetical protein